MKKRFFILFIIGCIAFPVMGGGQQESSINEDIDKTFVYSSELGDIELPKNPQRVVVLNAFVAGSIFKLYGDVVGHEKWTSVNPLFAEYMENSLQVDPESVEQVMSLNPDLIITTGTNKKIEELSSIAPTVQFSYGKLSYLDTIVEVGKVFGKEDEAKSWVKNFKNKVRAVGEQIKAKYGEDVTISVIEAFGDSIYLYGDNWGRGTQLVYQEMGLQMPESVKEVALKEGYYAISTEVIPKYSADLMILSKFEGSNTSFLDTETWKNIEAVKNSQVLEIPAESFYMTDPITLENQLKVIRNFFLNE